MSAEKFRSFISKLSQSLGSGSIKYDEKCEARCLEVMRNDVKTLKFFIGNRISKQKLENVTLGVELMQIMMEENLLTEQNTSFLESALDAASRNDLFQQLLDYKKSHNISPKAPCNVQEDMIDSHYMETDKSKELEDLMEKEDVVVISGCLGSGKTQLSIHFSCRFHIKNPLSTVWMIKAKDKESLHNSLKLLAQSLCINVGEDQETEETDIPDDSISRLGDAIARSLSELDVNCTHLFFFDDVNESCLSNTEGIIKKFLRKSRGAKIIVTTMNDLFLQDRKHLDLSGFSEEESIKFLSGNKGIHETEKEALRKIAELMSYLPLGLSGAKAYMTRSSISGKMFLKFLSPAKLQKLEGKLNKPMCDTKRRSLFTALALFIEVIQNDLDKDAYEMLQMTQFLNNDNLPVLLFENLPSESHENDVAQCSQEDFNTDIFLSIDSFVQAMKRFSFGRVRGVDTERLLSIHSAVSLTLQAFTNNSDKQRLVQKLLWALTWIFDKDNRNKDDYKQIVSLLPHARSVLSHAEQLLGTGLEVCLLMTYVNDIVAYMYSFEGFLELKESHFTQALQYSFKVMDCTEDQLDREVSVTKYGKTASEHRSFAKEKAQIIKTKLQIVFEQHSTEIRKFMERFVLGKRRVTNDVDILKKHLDDYEGGNLTMAQYNMLCHKKKAVPFDVLVDQFLIEILQSTFYTYGRSMFYVGKYATFEEKEKFCHYLFLADELGRVMQQIYPDSLPLYTMLARLSGTLELVFEDFPELEFYTVESLQQTADALELLIADKSYYFVFGLYKKDKKHHNAVCMKQLVRSYIALLKLTVDLPEKQKQIARKGSEVVDKLEQLAVDHSASMKTNGLWASIGEFRFAIGKYPEAEAAFKRICPANFLQGSVERRFVHKHELTAARGIADCYIKNGNRDEAEILLNNLVKMLPKTQMNDIEKINNAISFLKNK